MQNEIYSVSSFLTNLANSNIAGMKLNCSERVQFHNPLMGYLHSEQVPYFWEYSIINGIKYLNLEEPESLGEGYFKVKGNLDYALYEGVSHEQPLCLHLRIENEKITEYSEAFSLHKMAQIYSPFWGWLLGWNKYYQNNMKIKARKRLFELIDQ